MTIRECAKRINEKLRNYSRDKELSSVPLFPDKSELNEIISFLESLSPYELMEVLSPLILKGKNLDFCTEYVFAKTFVAGFDLKENKDIVVSKKLLDVINKYYKQNKSKFEKEKK